MQVATANLAIALGAVGLVSLLYICYRYIDIPMHFISSNYDVVIFSYHYFIFIIISYIKYVYTYIWFHV